MSSMSMNSKNQAIMVGCGAMSAEWIRSAKALNVRFVAFVDLSLDAARKRAVEFDLDVPVFATLDEAIGSVSADMAFDCTIPAAHVDVGLKALKSGLHLLEEKPLALNLNDARLLIDAAETYKRIHVVIQNRRFNPGLRRIRRLIDQGKIGEITTVNIDFFVPAHFGGFREKMEHVLLADMAIHPFDAVRFVTRANAESVYCDEWNPKGSWYSHGASAHALFRMENGIRFTFRGSWCSEGLRTAWDSQWRIVGTEGTIIWDGLDTIQGEKVRHREGFFFEQEPFAPSDEPAESETRGHFSVMSQFLRDIHEGKRAETRSSDNIHSLAMVLGAIESARTGQRVAIQ
jgi:predicted dehydrogenase